MRNLLVIIIAVTFLMACNYKTPETFVDSTELPSIYPDYVNITIPVNIAPLTFEPDGEYDGIVAKLTAGDFEVVCGGSKIQPDEDVWEELKGMAKENAINVEVYMKKKDVWIRFAPFDFFVSADSIDSYISYRLIPPSYSSYRELSINQRCLENYNEKVIYDNMICMTPNDGQCINCHNYQQYNPNRIQFHARHHLGGTVVAYEGKIKKINMSSDSILSAGVYPAWHPWLPLIVYSTNMTMQTFHITNPDKIEVYDAESDLIAYDIVRNEVMSIEKSSSEMEVFPSWAPDGRTIYFCCAHFDYNDSIASDIDVLHRFKEVKYNIYKKDFNPETFQFGPRELVFDAVAMGKSATLPRISPDGRYLMFALGKYGVFHIWHHDADLWMMDLVTGESRNLKEINSPDTESYHSWSSNGHWAVFSSRRDDGNYTRPFFTHFDEDGHFSKPFELPSADPDFHRQFLKSYNIPEFMHGPVSISPQEFAEALKCDGEPVKYVRQLRKNSKHSTEYKY